jgi:hypothetical protein
LFSSDADLFFLSPRTKVPRPNQFGVLYLLRRDIDQCMGIDPDTGQGGGPTALWPGAMAILAGVDLLAKFFKGSDKQGKAGERFSCFLEHFFGMNSTDREVIYQLRNALLHSFGLYSKTETTKTKTGKQYHFVLTDSGTGALVSHTLPDEYHVNLRVLHSEFETAVGAYCTKLGSDTQLQSNFAAMFRNYGSIPIA